MSQACLFATGLTQAIILFNMPNEHPIQVLQPASKPNNHVFYPLLKPQMLSARPQKGAAEKHSTHETTEELVHEKQDGVEWEGAAAVVGADEAAGAAPNPAHGCPPHLAGDGVQSCAYCHVGIPWISEMVGENIPAKELQDLEHTGGPELV